MTIKIKKPIAIILCVIVAVSAVLLIAYANPKIAYNYGTPVDKNSEAYCEIVSASWQTHFGLPLNQKSKAMLSMLNADMLMLYQDLKNYDKQKHIEVTSEYVKGNTIFKYSGYVYKDGEKIPYEKEYVIEGILPYTGNEGKRIPLLIKSYFTKEEA